MPRALNTLRAGNAQERGVGHHARDRRKGFADLPNLHRTHRFQGVGEMPVVSIPTDTVFPAASRARPITFATEIEVTAPSPTGLVFEFGSSVNGCALWLEANGIGFRAGQAAAADRALAFWDYGAPLGAGFRTRLTVAVSGDRVRIWGDGGLELARDVASGTLGDWSDGGAGSFAAAVAGSTPADVPETGAPLGFLVVEPLSAYVGQIPQHFV